MAFGLAAAVGAAIAKAVKTASDTAKKKGTSSGGSGGRSGKTTSSGRSSGKTTSSGGSGRSSGKTIEQYQQDWKDANARGDQAGMDAAHAGAQALRAQQGYDGGADGSQHISLGSSGSTKNTTSGTSSGSTGSSSSRKFYSGQYDQSLDYKALADEAAKNGNMAQAAIYEQMRNQKIKDQNLGYALTNQYAQYLGQTGTNGLSSIYNPSTGQVNTGTLNSQNTGAGVGTTTGYGEWAKGSAALTQNFGRYMDDLAAQIKEYEASNDPTLKKHLPGMYNRMAIYETQLNAQKVANGAGNLVTNDWSAYLHETPTSISGIGNAAKSLSAQQIAGYEQIAAKLEADYKNATNDYERKLIQEDLYTIQLMLGRATSDGGATWSPTTATPVTDHYGTGKDGTTGRSYGAWTNGTVNTDADRAVLEAGRQQALSARENYNKPAWDDWEGLLAGKPRLEASASGGKTSGTTTGTTTGGSKLTSALNLPGGKLAAGGIALGTLGAALAAQAAQGGTGGAYGTVTTTGGSTGSSSGGSSGGSYNYNNGSSGSTGSSSGGSMLDQYNQAYEDALKSLMQGQEAAKQQIELGVQQNVNNLESQKSEINAQLDKNNAEAEKLYMDAINPNGAIANQLAAMGLRDSGLTESSIISAGNTLQNNINANKREVASQIAKVDLAITNAQLEGNMQIAGVLADYAKAVADMGMTNASNVLSFQQWAAEFEESRKYNQAQLEMAQQQLAMQEKQLAQQEAQAQWERDQAEKNYQFQQEQWAAQQQQNRVDNQQYQRDYVYKLIANGTLPSHQTIMNAGMSDAEVYEMWKNVKAQMAAGY